MTTFIETLNHWGDHFLKFAWPMLWQSSLLITVIFVLEFALRRKIRAAIRYALWLVVLVKLLLPPSLALPTSPTWWIHPSVPPPAKAPSVSFTVSYGEPMAPNFPLPPAPAIPPPRAPAMSFAAWALTAAGVASAGLLAWLLFRWWQINQKVRRAKTPEKLIPILDETRCLTRLRPDIRLKLAEDSMSPAVCGLFRPVILLPQSLVDKLSDGQLRAVLLHEAIHLRRGDVWVNCAQALLQIVYWWHPLLWLANARIRRVREEAVDDAVMLALRDDAEIYAPTLLEVAKLAFNRPLASLGLVGILESRSALRQRIERLVNFNAPRKAGLTIVSILGILAFSAVALPMGEAPEKTNTPAPVSQPINNSPISTNAVNTKIESATLTQDGKTLYEMGKFDDAEAKLKTALALNPDNQAAHYYLDLVEKSRWAPKSQGPIIVYPASDGSRTNSGDVHTSPAREAIFHKLNSLRLESISWSNGLPLSEVIRYLAEQSTLHDPDKKGINFMFNPNAATGAAVGASNLINPATGLPETPATNAVPETVDVSAINVKLMLNNASLHDLLDAVVQGADHPIKYSIEDFAVVISPKPSGPEPPILEVRAFKIDTNTFIRNISRAPFTLENNSVAAMANSFFSAIGVNLNSPGRTVAFNDKLGLLFVKAAPSELEAIERVIQIVNEDPRQIHIKARFIEIPESEVGAILKAGTAVDTNTVEIIAADKMKSLLHQLESAGGVVAMAEPEAVTTSSRQVQMRTDNSIVDVIPLLLEDGYTLNLHVIAGNPKTLTTQEKEVNIWDGQTLALVFPGFGGKSRLVVFVTLWIVDPAGNLLHSDDELRQMQEKAKRDIPPQHTSILSDPNSRATLHALEQRTGVESLAEPEPVTAAGQGANRINRMVVPDKVNISTLTTNVAESDKLIQDGKLLYEMGKFEEAIAKLKEAIALNPDEQAAFYYLSLVMQAKFTREVSKPGWRKVAIESPVPNPSITTNDIQSEVTRVFRINQPMKEDDLKKHLLEAGVKIPPTVLVYTDDGILLVRGSEEQQDLIERVALKLNGVSPKEVKNIVNHSSIQKAAMTGENPTRTNLEMRVFKVDPNTFAAGLRGIPGLQTNSVVTMAVSLFDKLGVDSTATGRSIAFHEPSGRLFVKATPSELDTIERVIQAMNQVAPQIRIKARFIEVEQDNNAARSFDWYLGSFSNGPVIADGGSTLLLAVPVSAANPPGSFPGNSTTSVMPASATDQQLTSGLRNTVPAPATVTGILSDRSFRVTLHALQSRPRTMILAEPEATTTSGRQTQMRATDIMTVLTNINPLALKSPGVSSNELFLTKQVECGPVFDVVPYVLSDGYTISLTTTASVTEFLGYDKPTNSVTVYINGKEQTVPVPLPKFRTQRMSAHINPMFDGQSLVLSGPVTSATQTINHKVPLLADLPLVGWMFRSQTENSVEKKLMVFVTATIVDPAGNRVHSDDDLPFNPSTVPPQPRAWTPLR